MEWIGIAIAIALGIAAVIIAVKNKGKTVIESRSDLTVKTEMRIKRIEEKQNLMASILDNYELKEKK